MPLPVEWLDDIKQRASKCKKVMNAPVQIGHNAGGADRISLTDILKDVSSLTSNISHMVDVANVDGVISAGDISRQFRAGGPCAMAAPYGLKGDLGTTSMSFSLLIVPCGNVGSNHVVIKHLYFPDKVEKAVAVNLCTGKPFAIRWENLNFPPRTSGRCIEAMWDTFQGFQIRAYSLEDSHGDGGRGREKTVYTDEGFDYLAAKAQEVLSDRRQLGMMRWIHMETQDEASPIYNWPHGTVEKALNTIATEGSLAKVLFNWPMTLAALDPTLLMILKMIWSNLDDTSIIWLGVPGVGKTPASITVALARSRELGGEPSCITASEMDFFRQLVSTPKCPVILDDFDCSSIPVKAMKVFLDVAAEDRATWARWGGCRFATGCFSQAIDNKVALEFEPDVNRPPTAIPDAITHDEFMRMVSVAFHKDATPSDALAYLKRGNVIVPTNHCLYYRVAGHEPVDVPRLLMTGQKKDWIVDAWKPIYSKFKKGDKTIKPSCWAEAITWEAAWMKHARGEGPDPGEPPVPSFTEPPTAPKRKFQSLRNNANTSPIDLDDFEVQVLRPARSSMDNSQASGPMDEES